MPAIHKYLPLIGALLLVQTILAERIKVHTPAEFNQALKQLQPGDTLVFANGQWTDADLVITNKGTATKPIVLIGETPGQAIFNGQSRIRIGGEYVELNGLAFVNGYAGKNGVIEYRAGSQQLANHCRVTNCVIDNYNNSDRSEDNHWVELFGRNNRFDHNYIAGKKNMGTTLIVELNDALNRQNDHRIDHNYFGFRPRLGSNGGETIRIGTSTFSRTSSRTIIEENFFEHCNGEVEIISVKSCDNILRRNTFYECEGSLVLRHGNRNIVEENFFIGNHKEHTGGIRVINAGHTIRNNFFWQLAGEGFRSALAIMNGVPNSPLNRYDPVKDVTITGNVFVDCRNLEFCAGKDLERTAIPSNVLFSANRFITSTDTTTFKVNDDISGIRFQQNLAGFPVTPLPAAGFSITKTSGTLTGSAWNIRYQLPAPRKKEMVFQPYATPNNTGVVWYKPASNTSATGKLIQVAPGENTLYDMVLKAGAHDILELQPGTYLISKTIPVQVPLTIRAAGNARRPLLQFSGETGGVAFFSIENGGSLRLSNLRCKGLSANGMAECFIRTQPMIEHYRIFVDRCDFEHITDGRKQALLVSKGSYADTIQFTNCLFNDISGDVISIAAEKDDKGIYNAEYVIIRNCVFNKILMGAINVYRGGNDESTTGPYFIMDHCTFNQVGNVELGYAVRIMGVQYSSITNCIFNDAGRSGRSVQYEDYGWTRNYLNYCNVFGAGRIESFYNNITGEQLWKHDPLFVDLPKSDLRLQDHSPLKGKASDGKDVGAVWQNSTLHL